MANSNDLFEEIFSYLNLYLYQGKKKQMKRKGDKKQSNKLYRGGRISNSPTFLLNIGNLNYI